MRILIWSQHFFPETFLINDLARELVSQGHEVTVLTGKPNYPAGKIYGGYRIGGIQREFVDGMHLVRIPLLPRGGGSALGLIRNYLSFIFSGYLVAPCALRRQAFDAVFVYATSPLLQALPAIFVSWIKRAPLAVWVQDLWPESLRATGFVKNNSLLWAVGRVVRHIYRRADSILIQSEAFRGPVLQLSGQASKIAYFPNAITRPGVWPDARPYPAPQMASFFSVVFAGNMGTAQSCDTIVEAAQLLAGFPAIRFFMVGSGSRAADISAKVVAQGIGNVEMTGQLPGAAMPGVFALASVLLVTLADNPALSATVPSKVQSYLAAGKPIVAGLNGEGARVVALADAGLTCPAGDAAALAACVLRLYKMTTRERDRLGANGQAYFRKNFDLGTRTRELVKHLEDLRGNK